MMTRKEFLNTGLAGLAAAGSRFPARAQSAGRPKNVLLLMSDQHRRDCLGIEGNRCARTPNLDALARSGVRFGSAYCSNPVCTPSRASLLTGLYTHNHQAWNNTTPWPFERKTAAHYFGRAGYMTALIGKMHFVDAIPRPEDEAVCRRVEPGELRFGDAADRRSVARRRGSVERCPDP